MAHKLISLFTGAGGLDYGFEASGFETAVAVEMDSACCNTLRLNRPQWNILEDRIEKVGSELLLKTAKMRKKQVALLIGGPPCQPFSKSGFWVTGDTKRLRDPRSKTLNEFLRVLEDTLPRAFVLENVYGLAFQGKDEGLQLIERKLRQINKRCGTSYSFNWDVLNAADYGVPQIRERVFIVGCREGTPFEFPSPRFYDPSKGDLSKKGLLPYRTAWDALASIDPSQAELEFATLKGRYGSVLSSIPEGQNYLFHTERGEGRPLFKWRSRYWSFLLKLSKERPSWTIQAQPGPAIGPFHWENRRLTPTEMCRLQTFPKDIKIIGKKSDIQKQIGNAVPSALGELLGLEIRRQFFGEAVSSERLKLIPRKTKKPSKPSKVEKLTPAKINAIKAAEK